MIMYLLLGVLFGMAAGFYLGVRATLAEEVTKQVKQLVSRKVTYPFCIAEYEDGNYYLYDKESQAFLCQSITMAGLAEELSNNRKINIAFVLYPTGISNLMFWFIRGKVKPAEVQ